jgi:hypothetical protein
MSKQQEKTNLNKLRALAEIYAAFGDLQGKLQSYKHLADGSIANYSLRFKLIALEQELEKIKDRLIDLEKESTDFDALE